MRVWLRFLVSCLMLIGGMLLICAVGIKSAEKVRDRFHQVNESVPLLMHLKELRYAGQRIVSSTMEYSFLTDLGSADGKGKESPAKEKRRLLRQGFDLYRSELAFCARCMMDDPKQKDLYAKIEAAGSRLITMSKNFILLRDLHAPRQRLVDAEEEYEKAEASFVNTIDATVDFETGELKHQGQGALAVLYRAVSTASAFARFALALSLAVGCFISFSLSRRLCELRKGEQDLAAGKPGVTLPIAPADEIREFLPEIHKPAYFDRTGLCNRTLDTIDDRIETAHEEEVPVRNRCDNAQQCSHEKPIPAPELDAFLAAGTVLTAIPETGIVFPKLTT